MSPVDDAAAWVRGLRGSGEQRPAIRPSLVGPARHELGDGPVDWAIDLGAEMADLICAQVPEFAGSDGAVHTLRSGTEASTISALLAIATGEPQLVEVPEESLAGERDFVRRGIPMELVLRGMRLGHALLAERLIAEAAAALPPEQAAAEMARLSRQLFTYMDTFASRMAAVYAAERDQWLTSAAAARAEAVRRVLEDDEFSAQEATSALGYPVRVTHVAGVVWRDPDSTAASADDLSNVATELVADAEPIATLVVPDGTHVVRVWAAWRGEPPSAAPFSPPTTPGLHATVGAAGRGLAGFRRSHREAALTADLARTRLESPARTSSLTQYRDVELALLLAQDTALARAFVRRELGPLAQQTPQAHELRQTLAAYLGTGRSLARAAERLTVARNTVAYRVGKAQEILGHDLGERRLELEAALRLVEATGSQLLAPAADTRTRR